MTDLRETVTDVTGIRALLSEELRHHAADLGDLLAACVNGGASVNFVVPFDREDGEAWWRRKMLPGVEAGTAVLLAAFKGTRLVGTVALDTDTPPNQRHRGDVKKLLVHPDMRRRGIARALMAAVEAEASRRGRWLLTLDTVTGSPAERLYAGLGWEKAGVVPDYAARALGDGQYEPATFFFKRLAID
jgi:GNAT superfamily N-acetyltransferase